MHPDAQLDEIKKRGFNWIVPIGRSLTQHEEKNDVRDSADSGKAPPGLNAANPQADEQSEDDDDDDTDDDDSDDSPSEGNNDNTDSEEEEDEDEDEQDLDADMADMDEPHNASLTETEAAVASDDMDAEDSGEFEEGPSSEV